MEAVQAYIGMIIRTSPISLMWKEVFSIIPDQLMKYWSANSWEKKRRWGRTLSQSGISKERARREGPRGVLMRSRSQRSHKDTQGPEQDRTRQGFQVKDHMAGKGPMGWAIEGLNRWISAHYRASRLLTNIKSPSHLFGNKVGVEKPQITFYTF